MKRYEVLSRDNTTCLRGILAFMVVCIHLNGIIPHVGGTVLQIPFYLAGHTAVTVFFFLSAYGLVSQFQAKGEAYIRALPRRKVLPYYINLLLVIGLYVLFHTVFVQVPPLKNVLLSFLIIDKVVMFGWFLSAILWCYCLFALVFRICKSEKAQVLSFLGVAVALYIIGRVTGITHYWYVYNFGFVLGILWKYHEAQIEALLQKKAVLAGTVAFLFFVVSGFFSSTNYLPDVCGRLAQTVLGLSGTVLVLLLLRVVPIRCKVTRYLGAISLEMYEFQGMVYWLFGSTRFAVANPYLRPLAILVGTILLASLMHPILTAVVKKLAVKKS